VIQKEDDIYPYFNDWLVISAYKHTLYQHTNTIYTYIFRYIHHVCIRNGFMVHVCTLWNIYILLFCLYFSDVALLVVDDMVELVLCFLIYTIALDKQIL